MNFFKENQFKWKSTRYIDLNLTIFPPLYSIRTLQVNIFLKLFTQFKILNSLLFTVYITDLNVWRGCRHSTQSSIELPILCLYC